jgi:hypothetical protein
VFLLFVWALAGLEEAVAARLGIKTITLSCREIRTLLLLAFAATQMALIPGVIAILLVQL